MTGLVGVTGLGVVTRLVSVADHAVLVTFDGDISDATIARIRALDSALARLEPVGLVEVVPALTNLLVVFDPVLTDHTVISAAIESALVAPVESLDGAHHVVDVCYDKSCAPDLEAASLALGISEYDVVAAHSSARFRVGMYGFAPGYAYLYGNPASIQLPRNPTPGPVVPAGSVIITGQQCLIIPVTMSTGWFAIGRSSARVLTGDPAHPFLFDVGDTVSFRQVDAGELDAQMADQLAGHLPGRMGS